LLRWRASTTERRKRAVQQGEPSRAEPSMQSKEKQRKEKKSKAKKSKDTLRKEAERHAAHGGNGREGLRERRGVLRI
jgi:hypothetical protein